MSAKIDETVVRRLIATQIPQWKELPVRPVAVDLYFGVLVAIDLKASNYLFDNDYVCLADLQEILTCEGVR